MIKNYNIKSQDILILLKIILSGGSYGNGWNVSRISQSLYISQSEVSESLMRCEYSGLMEKNKGVVFKNALLEFIVHGIKYAFPVRPGKITRGIPTAHSAPPLKNYIVSENEIYVWPYEFGEIRGQSVDPLYRSVPKAIKDDFKLYEMLALIDGIRVGKSREKEFSIKIIKERLLNKQ